MTQAAIVCTASTECEPTWLGMQEPAKRHSGHNPGIFQVLLGGGSSSVRVDIGIRIGKEPWAVHAMERSGGVDGDSLWTYRPSFPFPAGAMVKYFFHASDGRGWDLWDSNFGQNFSFVVPAGPMVEKIAEGVSNSRVENHGVSVTVDKNVWIDFKVRSGTGVDTVGILWTDDGWTSTTTAHALRVATLSNGESLWSVDLGAIGRAEFHRSRGLVGWTPAGGRCRVDVERRIVLEYAIFHRSHGTLTWDNNGQRNYTIDIDSF